MSDVESLLRDTLTERSASAPDATGLADGARRRLRRRRTTRTIASAAVVAAVVAAAVPLGLRLWGGDGGPGAVDGPTVASEPPAGVEAGFRVETWRDLTFEVPDDWGHGSTTAWCTRPGPVEESRPVVARPDGVVAMIACTPGNGYGATISSPVMITPTYDSGSVWQYDTQGVDEAVYPDDAWLGYWYDESDLVTVVTPDRALTRRIVDSVRRWKGVDPNGCPLDLGSAEATTSGERELTLCRYDSEEQLSASGSWSGEEAEARLEALSDAPALPESGACTDQQPTGRIAVLGPEGYLGTAVVEGCPERQGIYFSGSARRITPGARDVLLSIG